MEIKDVRIVNETLESDGGSIQAPTAFFMDVKADEQEEFSVPISNETYLALNSLMLKGLPETARQE